MDRILGVVPPVLTPFDQNGQLIEGEFREYLSFLLDKGVDGVFVLGTTGEGTLLSTREREEVAKIAVDEVAGRKPIIVHAGAISTAETVELVRHAASIGATAASITAPWYFTYDDEALFRHYAAASSAAPDLPMMVYNYPKVGNAVSPPLLRRIVDACPNFVGLKDSSESLINLAQVRQVMGTEFNVLTGSVQLVAASLWIGADGIINSMSQTLPEMVLALYKAFVDGDRERTLEIQEFLSKTRNAFSRPVFAAQQKLVMHWRGFKRWHVRAPNREITTEEEYTLRKALDELGGLETLTDF